MAAKYLVFIILLLVFVCGCAGESQSSQQQTPQAQQTPLKEIYLENNDLKVRIYPTEDKKVSGVITVKLESLPSKATKLLVAFVPQGFKGSAEEMYNNPNVIIQWIENPSAGQDILIDTSKVKNGVYNVGVSATYENAPESNPWLALVQTQVNVQN
ncbi:MAG: hypothetical protein H0Z28_10635 [Archaeoglobus sp.]|nr:hypothetical protein [Archaeoglobus sp.]